MLNSKVLGALPWIYSLHWDSMICGHHIFMKVRIWTPFVGEIHHVQQEADKLLLKGLQLAIAKEITKGWFSQGD